MKNNKSNKSKTYLRVFLLSVLDFCVLEIFVICWTQNTLKLVKAANVRSSASLHFCFSGGWVKQTFYISAHRRPVRAILHFCFRGGLLEQVFFIFGIEEAC